MSLSEKIAEEFPRFVLETSKSFDEETVISKGESIVELCRELHQRPDFSFNFLTDLTAVDNIKLGISPRFSVVYHLYTFSNNQRLRIKVLVEEESAEVPSVTSIWPAANWMEREVWDMFGIRFTGHPHLKRIMMYEGFVGHPLRKDYPYNKRQPLIGPAN